MQPDVGNHNERMGEALLNFVTEEHQCSKRFAQASTLPLYPDGSDQLYWPAMSMNSSARSQITQSSLHTLNDG